MGKYRKGEQPVAKQVVDWSSDHPVARCMTRGSEWFSAWIGQMATPYDWLAKKTRIPVARLQEIDRGSTITRAEVEALAKAWWITPDGLIASLPAPTRIVS
jgi:hypothetical protein